MGDYDPTDDNTGPDWDYYYKIYHDDDEEFSTQDGENKKYKYTYNIHINQHGRRGI